MRPRVVWIVTDDRGEQDHLCLGISEALGVKPRIIRVARRWPFTWMPAIALRLCPPQRSAALTPPWPDMVLTAAYGAIPYVRAIKEQTCDYCFVCAALDPKSFYDEFDLVFVNERDGVRARPNVEVLSLSPISASSEATERLLTHYASFATGVPLMAYR